MIISTIAYLNNLLPFNQIIIYIINRNRSYVVDINVKKISTDHRNNNYCLSD